MHVEVLGLAQRQAPAQGGVHIAGVMPQMICAWSEMCGACVVQLLTGCRLVVDGAMTDVLPPP